MIIGSVDKTAETQAENGLKLPGNCYMIVRDMKA